MPCKTEGSDTLGWLFGGNRAMIQKKKKKIKKRNDSDDGEIL